MTNPPPDESVVSARVDALRQLIREVRGNERAVRLVAVTKTFDESTYGMAARAGCDAVGENYAQELLDKLARLEQPSPVPVHFIGHLQSNKVRALFPHVALWHTVDRASVVDALGKECARFGGPARVLIQVNSTDETQKSGCAPTDAAGLVARAQSVGLVVEGLMTMGPSSADPDATRGAFRSTAHLAADLGLPELSMGMTHDVRIALEEGSTIVRVGSGIFGERPRPA